MKWKDPTNNYFWEKWLEVVKTDFSKHKVFMRLKLLYIKIYIYKGDLHYRFGKTAKFMRLCDLHTCRLVWCVGNCWLNKEDCWIDLLKENDTLESVATSSYRGNSGEIFLKT